MKLGALSSKLHSPKRFALAPRLKDFCDLPLLADTCDYARRMSEPWGVMANDLYGDCVFAADAHLLQVRTANVGGDIVTLTDEQVLTRYSAVTGFDRNDPSTDNGTVPLDALRWLARTGKIVGFGLVDNTNDAHVAAALQLFGGVLAAYDLPESWISAKTWDATARDAPLAGGHMVAHVGHDRLMNLATISWGDVRTVTPAGRHQRCGEMWVVIGAEWLDMYGKTIHGLDLSGLVAATKAID